MFFHLLDELCKCKILNDICIVAHAGPPFPPPTRSPYPPPTGSPYPPPAGSPYPPFSGPTNPSPYPPPAGSFYPPPTGPPYSPPYPYDNGHQFNQYPPFAAPPYGSTSPQVNIDSQYSPVPSAPPLIEGYENMAFGVAGNMKRATNEQI